MNIYVFNPKLERIGMVNHYFYLQWFPLWGKSGSFKLIASLDSNNRKYLVRENLIWIEEEQLAVIEVCKRYTNPEQGLVVEVSGRFIESSWIGRRVSPQKMTRVNTYPTDIARDLISLNLISPKDQDRKIPNVYLKDNQIPLGTKISSGIQYKSVWEGIVELCSLDALDARFIFHPQEPGLEFAIRKGRDLSESIKISTDLGIILSSYYLEDSSTMATAALVAGQGDGEDRKLAWVIKSNTGIDRKEIFVDARDISDTDENGFTIPPNTYTNMLINRGNSKLEKNPLYQEYNATIKNIGDTPYKFERDYFLGDLITLEDKNLGVIMKARVSGAQKYYGPTEKSIDLVIGVQLPTITQLLKGE